MIVFPPNDDPASLYERLAACLAYPTDHEHVVAALEHRLRLIQHWGIEPGAKVLEIGCGQGEFTVALAHAVGPTGRIVAVDPAPLDWGTPDYASARAHVLASFLGPRITFVQADPTNFLRAPSTEVKIFDYIVFGYCIWSFADPIFLPKMLHAAYSCQRAPTVLIVECSLSISDLGQVSHLLAALTDNTLESFRGGSSQRNIRCALSPRQIRQMAEGVGWTLQSETYVTPLPRQIEGQREVRMATQSPRFKKELAQVVSHVPLKIGIMLQTMVEAVAASVERNPQGLASSRNMDAWVARFDA